MAGIGSKKTTGIYKTRADLERIVMARHREGMSLTKIAKQTRTSARTVKRIIEADKPKPKIAKVTASSPALPDRVMETIDADTDLRARAAMQAMTEHGPGLRGLGWTIFAALAAWAIFGAIIFWGAIR